MSRFITAAFLRSREYAQLMASRVPDPDNVDPGEANTVSESYRLRHADLAGLLGVWRWRGVSRHTVTILDELKRCGALVYDFGGTGGPLGLGSTLVDILEPDGSAEPQRMRALKEHANATCIFTSHCLEHIADLDAVLGQIANALALGGLLIAHVPAWTCVRWRAGIHTSPDFAPHCWDFGIEDEAQVEGLRAYTNVAARIAAAGLAVELAEYCGDDSIMVMARKVTNG